MSNLPPDPYDRTVIVEPNIQNPDRAPLAGTGRDVVVSLLPESTPGRTMMFLNSAGQWVPFTTTDFTVWGDITGDINVQYDLMAMFATKADDSAISTVGKTGEYSDLLNKPVFGNLAFINYPGGTSSFLRADGTWAIPVDVNATWGNIGGTIADQTDLVAQLNFKAPLANPVFTGNPRGPVPTVDNNSDSLATTSWFMSQGYDGVPVMDGAASSGDSLRWARGNHRHPSDTTRAPLESPAFTGAPTAPTPAVGNNSTLLATTAFVNTGFLKLSGGTLTGPLHLVATYPYMDMSSTHASPWAGYGLANNGLWRWGLAMADPDTGSGNGGGNFYFERYADDGETILGNPIWIERATGKVTMEAGLAIAAPVPYLWLKANAGQIAALTGSKGDLFRWDIILGNGSAESGANAGSDFVIDRYNDAGAWISSPLTIARSTGHASFAHNVDIGGNLNVTGAISGTYNGNAATATKLATARTINGVAFDGTANITVADATKASLTADNSLSGRQTITYGGGVNEANYSLAIVNGTNYGLEFAARSTGGAYNPMTQAGDARIHFGKNAIDTGTCVIGAWSNNRTGIRFTPAEIFIEASTAARVEGWRLWLSGTYGGGAYSTALFMGSRHMRNVVANDNWEMINAANSQVTATFSNNGDFMATGNVSAYSDVRLKTGLARIENALNKVQQLMGYTYTRKDTGQRQTGLLAQDVRKVLPEAVSESADGTLGLAYGNLMGLIVEAVKELHIRVSSMETDP